MKKTTEQSEGSSFLKFLAFTFIVIISITKMSAQTVGGIPIEDIPARYVKIVSSSKLFKVFQVNTYLDYGQISKIKDVKKGYILDDNGKTMDFNGVMGVLNHFESKGYRYVNQHIVTTTTGNVYNYLLENLNYKKTNSSGLRSKKR